MNIRELNEKLEEKTLSKKACLSSNSRGRLVPEDKCDIRTDFQRDRDRIIHSKAFRRLKDKTQVFISPEGDHYRTRLIHTLEVSQIARSIAKSLFLNEDLTEAIALAHDIGHTPFGHAGETVLNEICPHGFKHEEQGLRVVDVLEKPNGLNLTLEVRDGILNHSLSCPSLPLTLEGQIVRIADKIAYLNHDIDDSERAGIFKEEELPKEHIKILGNTYSKRLDTMIKAVIYESIDKDTIQMNPEIKNALLQLRNYMFTRVYINKEVKIEEAKTKNILGSLYEYLVKNPNKLPIDIQKKQENEDIDRVVCDYIAGMTDHYAIRTFEELFIPATWKE